MHKANTVCTRMNSYGRFLVQPILLLGTVLVAAFPVQGNRGQLLRQVLMERGLDEIEDEPWKITGGDWIRARLKRVETPPPHHASVNKDDEVTFQVENNDGKVECPLSEDGHRLFFCPTPDDKGAFTCIDDHDLCDRKRNCFNGEDEEETVCMFHRMTLNYIKVLMGAIYGLTKSVI